MEAADWNDENWDTLIYSIQQRNCILMLGPDIAVEQIDNQTRPSTEILANELAGKISSKIKSWNVDPSNLIQVSQCYVMEKGRNDLQAKVQTFYNKRQNLNTDLHKDLATLPFYFIITSTPDVMFRNALIAEQVGKEPEIEKYDFKGENPSIVTMGTVEKPLLFYLYGIWDKPQSLVLTEDDFLDFLVAVGSKNPRLPDNILNELRDKAKSFLFLGFGFRYWYLRILLHILKLGSKESRSFALEQFASKQLDEFQRMILFYRESGYRIEICNKEINSFIKELRRRYEESSSVDSSKEKFSKIKLQDAPTVFICHASEDKEYAIYLYEKLESAGFKPWLDKENIRGGDEWDRLIEKTIEKIDYFVVLQSEELGKKLKGYVNKEIYLALEHQRYFRPGIRFIIPTKIDDCVLLEDLDGLHTIDLSNKDNIGELIKTIKRDQQRRNKGGNI